MEFKIKTDLSDSETVDFCIMDSDTIFTNKGDRNDAELLKGKLRLNQKIHTIQFTEEMQKKAFKDTELYAAECYVKIYHLKSGNSFSEIFDVKKFEFKPAMKPFLIEPIPKIDTDFYYSEEEKAKIIAIVYGESKGDRILSDNIPWIYYNLTRKKGKSVEWGLVKSSFYNLEENDIKYRTYRICMYYLGKDKGFGQEYGDDYIGAFKMSIKNFINFKGGTFENSMKPALDHIVQFMNSKVFIKSPLNPYFGWEGQGDFHDMYIREKKKIIWSLASLYFNLQKRGKVKYLYVKEFVAFDNNNKDITTYLYDKNSILEFFEKNPNFVPEDLNEIKTIHYEIFKKK